MMHKSVTILHLFPDILNLYGDRGNIAALSKRLLWRGFEANVQYVNKQDAFSLEGVDIVYIGGGDANALKVACEALMPYREALLAYIEDGGVMLATCDGFEILGKQYEAAGERAEGLGLLDFVTEPSETRLIGNVVIESCITGEKEQFVGFENHGGRTNIGAFEPFGRVVTGNGNNGADGTCGLCYKNFLGTHLHGPLLPKNPVLTDYILSKALEKQWGEPVTLEALPDEAENEAHNYAIKRFTSQ